MKKPLALILVVAIPAISVVLGGALLVVSIQNADTEVQTVAEPLSKTSWRQTDD